MTTLIFVRHGQSVSNLNQIFTGSGDVALTELGHKQAELTARYLDRYKIDRIYSSDLSRAYDTAVHTARRQGKEIVSLPALREINAGLWEGLHFDELAKRFPESFEIWKTHLGHAHPDGGESTQELASRVYRAVDDLLEKHRGECIAVFSHATPGRMLACRWFGIDPQMAETVPFCSNASVSVIEYEDDGSFRLVCYGHNGHQGDLVTVLPSSAG